MQQEVSYPKRIPLKRAVCIVTGEADPNDQQGIRKAVRKWHNRLQNGTVPRSIFVKIGRELFLDLALFEQWIADGPTTGHFKEQNIVETATFKKKENHHDESKKDAQNK